MTTFFITGGYGFLGQYILQAVHQYDTHAELRVLVRTQRKTFLNLDQLERITWVRGDLTRPETFIEHLKGVDIVIHNAAMVSFHPADRQKLYHANVIGTRNLSQAALAAGCTNFIFISSISAVEFRPPHIADETFLPDLENKKKYDMYGYTKRLSEIELHAIKDRLRVVTLNPSVILGPGSERINTIIKILRKIPVLPMMNYTNAFVDVRDVARAVTLAVTKGCTGERYLVSAHNVSMIDFSLSIIKSLGKNSPVLPISPFWVKLADVPVGLLNKLHLAPGIRPPSQININKACSYEKIKTEMGWEPAFTLEQSIADSVNRTKDE